MFTWEDVDVLPTENHLEFDVISNGKPLLISCAACVIKPSKDDSFADHFYYIMFIEEKAPTFVNSLIEKAGGYTSRYGAYRIVLQHAQGRSITIAKGDGICINGLKYVERETCSRWIFSGTYVETEDV